MDGSVLFFISSGIFLGWSLGANHAVNVFGTAVMSKMVRYRVAATVAGIFVLLGAVFGGAGATRTITELGAVNALAGGGTINGQGTADYGSRWGVPQKPPFRTGVLLFENSRNIRIQGVTIHHIPPDEFAVEGYVHRNY